MKKILVCLDGSPRENGVLDAAVALAGAMRARVVLFRAVGIPREMPQEALAMSPADVPALMKQHARAELEDRERRVPEELRAGIHVAVGTPWQSIERAATEVDADLIVIGSHGHEGFDRLLGTTAAKVVNHADRAVLVVREPGRLLR